MLRHLYEYFQLPGHTGFLQDTYVTLTDKINPRAPTKHEDYWIYSLTILTGKYCVLFNSVQKLLVGCF